MVISFRNLKQIFHSYNYDEHNVSKWGYVHPWTNNIYIHVDYFQIWTAFDKKKV